MVPTLEGPYLDPRDQEEPRLGDDVHVSVPHLQHHPLGLHDVVHPDVRDLQPEAQTLTLRREQLVGVHAHPGPLRYHAAPVDDLVPVPRARGAVTVHLDRFRGVPSVSPPELQ